MSLQCSFPRCKSASTKQGKVIPFPKKWKNAIPNLNFKITVRSAVCESHYRAIYMQIKNQPKLKCKIDEKFNCSVALKRESVDEMLRKNECRLNPASDKISESQHKGDIYCVVPTCLSTISEGRQKFFAFPEASMDLYREDVASAILYEDQRKAWIEALNLDMDEASNNKLYICSLHFVKRKPALVEETKHVDWVPRLNLAPKTVQKKEQKPMPNYTIGVQGDLECVVPTCLKQFGKRKFFKFPEATMSLYNKDIATAILYEDQRKAWIDILNLQDMDEYSINRLFICSLHFSQGHPAPAEEIKHIDWIPSSNLSSKLTPRTIKKPSRFADFALSKKGFSKQKNQLKFQVLIKRMENLKKTNFYKKMINKNISDPGDLLKPLPSKKDSSKTTTKSSSNQLADRKRNANELTPFTVIPMKRIKLEDITLTSPQSTIDKCIKTENVISESSPPSNDEPMKWDTMTPNNTLASGNEKIKWRNVTPIIIKDKMSTPKSIKLDTKSMDNLRKIKVVAPAKAKAKSCSLENSPRVSIKLENNEPCKFQLISGEIYHTISDPQNTLKIDSPANLSQQPNTIKTEVTEASSSKSNNQCIDRSKKIIKITKLLDIEKDGKKFVQLTPSVNIKKENDNGEKSNGEKSIGETLTKLLKNKRLQIQVPKSILQGATVLKEPPPMFQPLPTVSSQTKATIVPITATSTMKLAAKITTKPVARPTTPSITKQVYPVSLIKSQTNLKRTISPRTNLKNNSVTIQNSVLKKSAIKPAEIVTKSVQLISPLSHTVKPNSINVKMLKKLPKLTGKPNILRRVASPKIEPNPNGSTNLMPVPCQLIKPITNMQSMNAFGTDQPSTTMQSNAATTVPKQLLKFRNKTLAKICKKYRKQRKAKQNKRFTYEKRVLQKLSPRNDWKPKKQSLKYLILTYRARQNGELRKQKKKK